jgi:uncharacterized membrane protein
MTVDQKVLKFFAGSKCLGERPWIAAGVWTNRGGSCVTFVALIFGYRCRMHVAIP